MSARRFAKPWRSLQQLPHRVKQKTFDLRRALLHFPVGLFVAWLTTFNVPLAYLLGVSFLVFELAEDWRIFDRGFLDISGYAFGLGAGGVILWLFG